MLTSLLDLVLPRECGGCGRPDTWWCDACRAATAHPPVRVHPRVDPGVPCWALGPYSGVRRHAVVAVKEKGARALVEPLGSALAGATRWLRSEGEIDPHELSPLTLVPAPSRRRAARLRGGDPVTRFCGAAAAVLVPEVVTVAPILRVDGRVRDSVGLSARERAENLGGRIGAWRSLPGDPARTGVVLVDDVLTTGTTAAESVAALRRVGARVDAVLVLAAVR